MSTNETTPANFRRVRLPAGNRGPTYPDQVLWNRGWWRARWLVAPVPSAALAAAGAELFANPFVMAFRLRVDLDAPARLRIHVSGDERYKLLIDGRPAHDGPERSHAGAWRFASFDLNWAAGEHWLALRVWVAGDQAPINQISVCPGIIVAAEGDWHDRISTGVAPWESRALEGYTFETQPHGFFTGPRTVLDAARLPWGWETGAGSGFTAATVGRAGHTPGSVTDQLQPVLTPERLPNQVSHGLPDGSVVLVDAVPDRDAMTPACDPAGDRPDEHATWQSFLDGRTPLVLPSGALRRCLVDLGVYRACWPRVAARGLGTGLGCLYS